MAPRPQSQFVLGTSRHQGSSFWKFSGTSLVPPGSFWADRPSSLWLQLYFPTCTGHSLSLGVCGCVSSRVHSKPFSFFCFPQPWPISLVYYSIYLSKCGSKPIWNICVSYNEAAGFDLWFSNFYCNIICSLPGEHIVTEGIK